MKVAVIYFSQTGNTRKVGEALSRGLEESGAEVKKVSLKKAKPEDAAECELVGIGTPCFSSRAPRPVLDFISALPSLAGKKAFVFATSGGGPGRVLYDLTTALRGKDAEVLGGILVRGECFHPFPAIKGRFPGRPDERDLAEAGAFARSVYEYASSGKPGPVPGTWPGTLDPAHGFYDLIALTNTDDQLRAVLKPPQVIAEKCTQCRWCEHACPTGSIALDPLPRITGGQCLRCYRCFTGCPEQAFTAEIRLGNFLSYLVYNTFFERRLGDVKLGEKFY